MKKIFTYLLFLIIAYCPAQISHTLSSQSSDFQITQEGSYKFIRGKNTSRITPVVGAPQLPVISESFVLPPGSTVTNISINNGTSVLLEGNIDIYPTQPPSDWKTKPAFVQPNSVIYNSTNSYPSNTLIKTDDEIRQGYHIVTLDICPFNYIPTSKQLYLYENITINIQYTIGQIEYQEKISKFRHELTKDWVRSTVVNPQLLNSINGTARNIGNSPVETDKMVLHWKPSAYGDMPDFIIITNELLKPHFEQLANYKNKRGIPTLIVTTEQIYSKFPGMDKAEKIRNYLKSAHKFWGSGLFVLLGGDTAIIPERIATYEHNSKDPSDLYYSDVYKVGDPNYNWNKDGNANYGESTDQLEMGADNFIGRAPVNNVADVQNFVQKITKYESLNGVSDKSYVNNMLFLGSYLDYNHSTNTGWADGQYWHDYLAGKPFLVNNNDLKNWQLYDDYQGPPKHNYPGDDELDKSKTISLLSGGKTGLGKFHLVSHYDHGGPFGVGVSGVMKKNSIYREDMYNLTNGNELQIMYTTACSPGKFSQDVFAEHYINSRSGGGVAILANSATVYTGAYEQDVNLFHSIYGSKSADSYIMGVAFANARDTYGKTGYDAHRRKVLTFFGDPTMATWSATPQNINITTPASITISNTNANTLTVGLNALSEEATLTLYKFNTVTNYPEIFTSKKVPAGSTTAVFNLNPDTVGDLLVQATAKNYLPATKNVTILMPQSHLYITGYSFVDSNGNGYIEPGENISLTVNVQNSGGTAISNINATLTGNSNLVSVTQANSSYSSSINAGETIQLTGFTFTPLVAIGINEIPDFLEFKVNLTASGNYTHLDNFYLDVYNSKLSLGKRAFTINGNIVTAPFPVNQEINAKITIGNIGNVSTGELTAVLSSGLPNNILQIITSNASYESIPINDEKTNGTAFKFKLLQTYTGTMPFKLTLTNSLGKTWEFNFDMNEPLPPLITGFDFNSSIDQINLSWTSINNIGGYNIYRSDTETGSYIKKNEKLLSGTSSYSDYNLEKKTKYYYKISVVSLSGNERTLENVVTQDNPAKQGYLAWTSLNQHSAFPITTAGPILSSPMLYDIDGDGKKEIFQNSVMPEAKGRIYGFYESGQELYNIDGNETTISGFANTDIRIESNSAFGDLDKDGHAEVVTMGRMNNTSAGHLHIHKTIDENNDQKPDAFWDTPLNTGWRSMTNPVLYDINNDGMQEIIIVNENQKIQVFDSNKNMMPGWPIQIPGADWSIGHVAVADLDNDGFAEIALGVITSSGTKGGIYIYNHDGTPFTTNPFKEFSNNERADGGITFADIDNDGEFEVLAISKIGTVGKIRAYKLNGNPVNSTWENFPTFAISNGQYQEHWMSRISVGDLNNDGNLEIVFASKNRLFVLDKDGNILPGFQIPKTINDSTDSAPILADIDGDTDIEIIINSGGVINAYNPDGSECIGWRLKSNNGSAFVLSPAVDDIDNDGLNEIVASAADGTIFVWDTDGKADRIEWGSYRGNPQNTGTYKNGCKVGIDLSIKDGPSDLGIEPNNFTQFMWTSEDIWIRNNNDSGLEHQNPKYKSNNQPNYIKIRIKNRGCKPSTGTETLTMNWAKANTNLAYPENWNGSLQNALGFPLGGQIIGTPATIPVIQPGEEAIVTIPWIVPNPSNYLAGSGSENPWHFCVLATILGSSDPLTHPYTSNPNIMVRENNNQAWKNLTVVNTQTSTGGTLNAYPNAVVAVSNHSNSTKSYTLELIKESNEEGKAIFKEAEVTVGMDNVLFDAWVRGGSNSSNLQAKNNNKEKLIQGNEALLSNISMNASEYGLLTLTFNFLTEELTDKSKFTYHLIQKDSNTGEVIGGETFVIKKNPRSIFEADAGGDIVVARNQPAVLEAADINEPAIYNWYDSSDNLIHQGTDLQISNARVASYKLEVISEVDGFKDYDHVNVTLLPNSLDLIVPNPASNNVSIQYTLNGVNSAYLRVTNYYGTVINNYILDVNSMQKTIDVSGYITGFYIISLVCDGQLVDSKTLIKQ